MRIGLALSPLDRSGPGEAPPQWPVVAARARRAEELGFHSVWLSDHLPGFDPLVGTGALARRTSRVGLGLAVDVRMRPATVLAKALATLDVLSEGRLVVALDAGDEGPEEGAARQAEAAAVLRGMWGGGPYRFEGRYERAVDARCLPRPVRRPGPPVWLEGAGDPLLEVVARCADGWSTAWTGTPDGYREQVAALHDACRDVGRDPSSVALAVVVPALAGTVEQVRERLDGWAAVGVSTVVVGGAGAVPGTGPADDLVTLAEACSLEPCRTSDPWN